MRAFEFITEGTNVCTEERWHSRQSQTTTSLPWMLSSSSKRTEFRKVDVFLRGRSFAPTHDLSATGLLHELHNHQSAQKMADQSIRSLFSSAERQRKEIEDSWETNTATYQTNLQAAIKTYDDCLKLADRASLFSPNEGLEDLTSGDLQYLTLNYRIADLLLRTSGSDRKAILQRARHSFEQYLSLLDNYDILSIQDKKLYEQYHEYPTTFSTISTTNSEARRANKIANFKLEKELKKKLEVSSHNAQILIRLC